MLTTIYFVSREVKLECLQGSPEKLIVVSGVNNTI